MEYKILIDTKKKRQLTNEEAGEIIEALHKLGYKSGEIKLITTKRKKYARH